MQKSIGINGDIYGDEQRERGIKIKKLRVSHINLVNINCSNYKQCLLLHTCLKKLENGFDDKNCVKRTINVL